MDIESVFFFAGGDRIRRYVGARGLGDFYKRQDCAAAISGKTRLSKVAQVTVIGLK